MSSLSPIRLFLGLTIAVSLVSLGSSAVAEEHVMPKPPAESAQFKQLKSLVGTWEGTIPSHEDGEPQPITVTYELTAGGSVVLEKEHVGTPMEMLTLYYMDGDDLVLTHYCMLANQPSMKAQPSEDPNVIPFGFNGGANIITGNEMHMRSVEHTLVNENHIQSTWTMHNEGELANTSTIDLHRKPIED